MRKVLKSIIRAIYLLGGLFLHYMERMGNWFIGYHKKTEYIKKGACNKCGLCCRLLAIQYPNFFNRFPRIIGFTIKWHEYRYNFTYLNREENCFLYECNYLTEDGRCKIYRFRPRLCREYPKMILYGKPPKHPTCGFYFVRRDGRPTFDKALHDAAHKVKGSEDAKQP